MHINKFLYCFYLSLNDFKDVVICCHSIFVQYENVHETSCEHFHIFIVFFISAINIWKCNTQHCAEI